MSQLFADVPLSVDDTMGMMFASGRIMRQCCGNACPWCLVAPEVNCKPDCPLRDASADAVNRVIDARDIVEQYEGDAIQARRSVIAAIASEPNLRERLARALAYELLDTGLYETIGAAFAFSLQRILRVAGALPPETIVPSAPSDLSMPLL